MALSLELVSRQVGWVCEGPLIGGIIGVMEAIPSIRQRLPGIDTRAVSAVVIRLQPLAGGQLGVGDDEIQLHPALIAVFDPKAVVLVGIEAGHQSALKIIHDGIFTLGGHVVFGKAQNTAGVLLGIPAGVDQLPRLLGVAAQHRRPLAVPILAQQVPRRA